MIENVIGQVRRKAGQITFGNALYNWSLGGSVPTAMTVVPTDAWPGNAEAGRWLCGGAFAMEDAHLEMHGDCWEPVGVSENWLAHMHGFSWLRDLRAVGGDQARQQARSMIESWIKRHQRWSRIAWRPDLTGRRIANWISLYNFYGASAHEEFQAQLFESLTRQARHLSRALPGAVSGVSLLYGIRGLAFAGLAFAGRESWLEQALDLLQQEGKKQILSDGGHASRSPAQLLEALRVYIDIRSGLVAGGYPVPEQLAHTIDRMAQALRFFRYADKRFSVFNGAQESDEALIESVLLKSNAQGRILRNLPQSGYERLALGRSVVMMDCGAPPASPYDGAAHAAPLAFEFAYGRERIFVSCGAHPLEPQWNESLRATAAHNSVIVDHRNACEVRDGGHIGRRPRTVMVHREDNRDAVLVEASHDGYLPVNGITHRRRLYLSHQGHDLRGEETLSCSTGLGRAAEIAVRFHLHPKVQVSLIQDGREALLRLPGGAGWRFFHSGGVLALEESLYLGQGTHPRKTRQLVIHGLMEGDAAQIKWALHREGR